MNSVNLSILAALSFANTACGSHPPSHLDDHTLPSPQMGETHSLLFDKVHGAITTKFTIKEERLRPEGKRIIVVIGEDHATPVSLSDLVTISKNLKQKPDIYMEGILGSDSERALVSVWQKNILSTQGRKIDPRMDPPANENIYTMFIPDDSNEPEILKLKSQGIHCKGVETAQSQIANLAFQYYGSGLQTLQSMPQILKDESVSKLSWEAKDGAPRFLAVMEQIEIYAKSHWNNFPQFVSNNMLLKDKNSQWLGYAFKSTDQVALKKASEQFQIWTDSVVIGERNKAFARAFEFPTSQENESISFLIVGQFHTLSNPNMKLQSVQSLFPGSTSYVVCEPKESGAK